MSIQSRLTRDSRKVFNLLYNKVTDQELTAQLVSIFAVYPSSHLFPFAKNKYTQADCLFYTFILYQLYLTDFISKFELDDSKTEPLIDFLNQSYNTCVTNVLLKCYNFSPTEIDYFFKTRSQFYQEALNNITANDILGIAKALSGEFEFVINNTYSSSSPDELHYNDPVILGGFLERAQLISEVSALSKFVTDIIFDYFSDVTNLLKSIQRKKAEEVNAHKNPNNTSRKKRFIPFIFIAVIIIAALILIILPNLNHLNASSTRAPVAKATQSTIKPSSTLSPKQQQEWNNGIANLFSLPTNVPLNAPAPTSISYNYPGDDYVANRITKIYHLPWCDLLELLSESNREYFHATPDQMENAGYRPCLSCENDILRRATDFPSRAGVPLVPVVKNTYTVNTSSKVFHKPSCVAISQIGINNCKKYICSRQEMISMGYSPCQRCHP